MDDLEQDEDLAQEFMLAEMLNNEASENNWNLERRPKKMKIKVNIISHNEGESYTTSMGILTYYLTLSILPQPFLNPIDERIATKCSSP